MYIKKYGTARSANMKGLNKHPEGGCQGRDILRFWTQSEWCVEPNIFKKCSLPSQNLRVADKETAWTTMSEYMDIPFRGGKGGRVGLRKKISSVSFLQLVLTLPFKTTYCGCIWIQNHNEYIFPQQNFCQSVSQACLQSFIHFCPFGFCHEHRYFLHLCVVKQYSVNLIRLKESMNIWSSGNLLLQNASSL